MPRKRKLKDQLASLAAKYAEVQRKYRHLRDWRAERDAEYRLAIADEMQREAHETWEQMPYHALGRVYRRSWSSIGNMFQSGQPWVPNSYSGFAGQPGTGKSMLITTEQDKAKYAEALKEWNATIEKSKKSSGHKTSKKKKGAKSHE